MYHKKYNNGDFPKHEFCSICWMKNLTSANMSCFRQDSLACGTNVKRFDKGDLLFGEKTSKRTIWCIQKGVAKVSTPAKKNNEFILWLAGAGDMIGLEAFLNQEPGTSTAIAVTPVVACAIQIEYLENVLNTDPEASLILMQGLCQKLNFLEHRIASISKKTIKEQLAEMLVFVAGTERRKDKPQMVNYTLHDLASLLGTNKHYLYKVLPEFVEENILKVIHRRIYIQDFKALQRVACIAK